MLGQETGRRWSLMAALGLMILVAVVGFFVLLPGDDRDSSPSDQKDGSPAAATSSSTCGLPDGDQGVPDGPPAVDWRTVDRMTVPVQPAEYGPAEESDGIYSCFARNAVGAVLAASIDTATKGAPGVDQVELIERRYVDDGENFERELETWRTAEPSEEPAVRGQIVGFRVQNYSADEVRFELLFRISDSRVEIPYLAYQLEMRWVEGDWRMVIPDSWDNSVSAPRNDAGFTVWGGGPPASEGVSRSAPKWALSSQPGVGPGPGMTASLPLAAAIPGCGDLGALECTTAAGDALTVTPGEIGGALAGEATDAASDAAAAVADSAFERVAQDMVESAEWALEEMLTAWLDYPSPDLEGSDSATMWLQGQFKALVLFIMVASVFVSCYRLAVSGRFEHLSDLSGAFVRVMLTAGLVTTVVSLGIEIGDLFSEWVLSQVEFDLEPRLDNPLGPAWILLITSGLVVLCQIFQFCIMVVRYGVIVYLSAGLVLFAAGSMWKSGKMGWERATTWLLAFILYKPVAAVLYAGIMKLQSSDRAADQVAAIAMMFMALFALPALMRLLAPATAALGGANSGAMAGATVGAAVATGAVLATAGSAGAGGFAGASGGSSAAGGGAGGATTAGGGAGGGPAIGQAPSAPPSGAEPVDTPAPMAGRQSTTDGATGATGDDGTSGSPGLDSQSGSAAAANGSEPGARLGPAEGTQGPQGSGPAGWQSFLSSGQQAAGQISREADGAVGDGKEE